MRRRDTALAIMVALIWGTNFVAIRAGLDDVPPLLFVAIRFLVVCIPAVFVVPRPDLPWRDLLLIGIFISLGQFGLMYLSLHLGMPPGLASLVLQAQVLFTVLIAATWLRERPTRRQVAGVVLGGVGLVMIAAGRGLAAPLLPLAVLVLAAASWAVGNVLTRRAGSVSGLGLTVWAGLVVPLPALGLSFVFEGPAAIADGLASFGWKAAASTAFTAYLSSLVGYGVWNTLLSRHPVAKVTPFAMLVPVFGMAAAALAFRERPTAPELAGGIMLLAGVAVAVLRRSGPTLVDVGPAPGTRGETWDPAAVRTGQEEPGPGRSPRTAEPTGQREPATVPPSAGVSASPGRAQRGR